MNEMNVIRVPRALEGLEPLTLEMGAIHQAEGRLQEVSFTNASKAGELLALFNGAFLNVSKYLNLLEYELDVADRRLAEVRAIFIIDKLPALLAEKGFSTARSPLGSEDIRQAFLDRDEEYKKVQEIISSITCYVGLLETIKIGFVNGYNSVKKLLGTDGTSWRPNQNLVQPLTGDRPTQKDIAAVAIDINDDFFGTPR